MQNDNKMHTKGNILKVIELGLDKRIYEEMKKPRFSVEAITRGLQEEGVKITAQSIRKFIKNTKKAQQELIAKDLNAAAEFKQLTMDYGNELKKIMDEVEEVKTKARNSGDLAGYNQMIGRLMQGIELIAKLTGDIKPKNTTVDINIIYNEINNTVEKEMKNIKNIIDIEAYDIEEEIKEEDLKAQEALNNSKGED